MLVISTAMLVISTAGRDPGLARRMILGPCHRRAQASGIRSCRCVRAERLPSLAGIAAMVALALVDATARADAALDRRQADLGGMQPLRAACRTVRLVARRAGIDAAVDGVGPWLGRLVARLFGLQQGLGLRQRLLGCDPAFARAAAGCARPA